MKSEEFWSFLGKLALVLGLIWICIQIFGYFSSKDKYDIKAYCSFDKFLYPKQLLINKQNNNLHSSPIIDTLDEIYSIFIFEIKNDSKKQVNDLNLEIPNEGFFSIIKDNNNPVLPFNKKISLGSLRPTNELKIVVWTTDYKTPLLIFGSFDSKYKITYPEGYNEIEFYSKVTGILSWFHNVGFLFFCVLLLLLIISLFVMLLMASNKKKAEEGPRQS